MRRLTLLFCFLECFTFIGCESSSVSEDVAMYCECKSNIDETTTQAECNKIIEGIVVKYEYDSEALIEIQESLQACM
jgi:hypothetical protein